MSSLYWHDYETFGANPRFDRPCQFAGLRTDEALNVIGDPLVLYCRPADDFLPEPGACLVTGITPQEAAERGLPEREFCQRILAEFATPGSCVVGYNSIRFDDEITRHMLYRCLQDPYAREWQGGNSRWDLIDVLRLAHALRPEGIEWPRRVDGQVSFRLEDLCTANGIEHTDAHDALSDIQATIAMAKCLREAQPKLYNYCFHSRFKKKVDELLKPALLTPGQQQPLVHVSGMFGAERGNLGVVMPLLRDPVNRNAVHVYDLCEDPAPWLALSADEIRERLYTPGAELAAAGISRVALKTIHINRCPVVAPLTVLDERAQQRWGINLQRCDEHLQQIRSVPDLAKRLQAVYADQSLPARPGDDDPDGMLYSGGFFSARDRGLMQQLQSLRPEELASARPDFEDARLPELLFRLRARNYPDSLSASEQNRWWQFRRQRLLMEEVPWLNWPAFQESLQAARGEMGAAASAQSSVLDDLAAWGEDLKQSLQLDQP